MARWEDDMSEDVIGRANVEDTPELEAYYKDLERFERFGADTAFDIEQRIPVRQGQVRRHRFELFEVRRAISLAFADFVLRLRLRTFKAGGVVSNQLLVQGWKRDQREHQGDAKQAEVAAGRRE